MKGWHLLEVRKVVGKHEYRLSAPVGAPAKEMIEVMQGWIIDLEKLAVEAEEKQKTEESEGESTSEDSVSIEQE